MVKCLPQGHALTKSASRLDRGTYGIKLGGPALQRDSAAGVYLARSRDGEIGDLPLVEQGRSPKGPMGRVERNDEPRLGIHDRP